jgi:PKD repeat protein
VAAADTAGNVHVAWQSSNSTIQTAIFDPVAPTAALAPQTAVGYAAGETVPFAATVSDAWSNPVSVRWDFGDGQTGSGDSSAHAYGTPGQYEARAVATDAAGNSAATPAQTVTVTAGPTPSGLARPLAGKTVNLEPVSGVVLVKVPGSNNFVPLVTPTQVTNGSIIDARKGRVRITIDNGKGGLDTAEFFGGIFRFTQPKVKAGQLWFANLYLFGGSFKGCPRAPRNPKIAGFSKARANPKRSVRQLWGSGKGAFRTVGRFSSATIRGTTWLTNDRCDGTLTKVTVGKVGVRDFVLKKTIVVKARKSYLAKPKAKTARKKR